MFCFFFENLRTGGGIKDHGNISLNKERGSEHNVLLFKMIPLDPGLNYTTSQPRSRNLTVHLSGVYGNVIEIVLFSAERSAEEILHKSNVYTYSL